MNGRCAWGVLPARGTSPRLPVLAVPGSTGQAPGREVLILPMPPTLFKRKKLPRVLERKVFDGFLTSGVKFTLWPTMKRSCFCHTKVLSRSLSESRPCAGPASSDNPF